MYGQAVSVETPHNRSYYNSNRFLATKEVLQQKVDPLINFSQYDNWTYNSDYNHTNQPDGNIDMIIMIWRGMPWGTGWYGIADLGNEVHLRLKMVQRQFRQDGEDGDAGSGVTSNVRE